MGKMQGFSENEKDAARQEIAAEPQTADVLNAYSFEDDSAIVYSDNDEVGDYIMEKHPILMKYVPGKNDWSALTE
jgi:hypothetical protein